VVCACIDIGSNTTRLLVAEPAPEGLREVLAHREFTHLRRGAIAPDDVARIAGHVARQVRLAREAGAERIRTVATAAVRDAPNADELCAAIARAAGVEVEVLSGDEEARLAFAGVTGAVGADGLPSGRIGVADVGGGSTELVCGTRADGVGWCVSFRVGSGLLADAYLRSDPPSARELHAVRQHAAGVFEGLDCPHPVVAFAVGGSATSLRRLLGAELTPEALSRAIDVLAGAPAAEVAERHGLATERVRLLPAGILLLEEIARTFGAPMRIARGGLREGVVMEQLELHGQGR
jgi:exopolyphosphatase/guanosine-5'-triphosphate,3'-diphosphate pyrophosphatase